MDNNTKKESKMFHCSVCDCDVTLKCRIKHLNSKKHLENSKGEMHEEDNDKRKCRHCHSTRFIEFFRNDNRTCNKCLENNKRYKQNHPEKTAEWNKTYFEKNKNKMHYCSICDYTVKNYKKTQHERSMGHTYLLELKERGEEPEKPDRITIDKEGKEWYDCHTCKGSMLKSCWASHLIGSHRLKCKKQKEEENK
jgi:hypothetical protein